MYAIERDAPAGELALLYAGRLVATIRRRRGAITWSLIPETVVTCGLSVGELERYIERLVALPLNIRRMRRRALPGLFNDIEPNSAAHFRALVRDVGPFSVAPMQLPEAI